MPCRICHDLTVESPSDVLRLDNILFTGLQSSVLLGCQACFLIESGINSFKHVANIVDLDISSSVERHQEERLGERLLLRVTTRDINGDDTNLEFYSTDVRITHRWPLIPIASHISTDSSSPGCLHQARKWLDHCIQNHGLQLCRSGTRSKLPTRVIKVGDASTRPYLHESAPGETGCYATLSYCWGAARTFITTISSYSQRKTGFSIEELPKTCHDAVLVARALSIPNLWIDSLCILQDSTPDWEFEAANMCDIYENALVTFAAVDSPSSDSGLFTSPAFRRTVEMNVQLQDHSNAHVYVRETRLRGRLGLGFIHGYPSNYDILPNDGILQTRGWTLQELTLSTRVLWFTSSELGWTCWKSCACECNPLERESFMEPTVCLSSSAEHDSSEWMRTWREIIHQFTKRDLSYQKDRLPALSGLAKAFNHHVGGEYLAGMWESNLTAHLLWSSSWEVNHGPSSQASTSMTPYKLGDHYAPSWSWASVFGAVMYLGVDLHRNFRWFWRVVDAKFHPSGTNLYGPGSGWLVIEGNIIPLRVSGGSFFYSSGGYDDESLQCPIHQSSVLLDPRVDYVDDWSHMDGKRIFFVFAGSMAKKSESGAEIHKTFCGLVIEDLDGDKFRRLGYLESPFGEAGIKGGWDSWETLTKRKRICLV